MEQQIIPFDYDSFDLEDRLVLQQKASEIKTLIRRSAADIIEIGTRLIEVRERLSPVDFAAWLDCEFAWSAETARKFMLVATQFPSLPPAANIQAKALYLLAAPSTPDEAREEAVRRLEIEPDLVLTEQSARRIIDETRERQRPLIPSLVIPTKKEKEETNDSSKVADLLNRAKQSMPAETLAELVKREEERLLADREKQDEDERKLDRQALAVRGETRLRQATSIYLRLYGEESYLCRLLSKAAEEATAMLRQEEENE